MEELKNAVNDHRFTKMCASLAAMVSVGGVAGAGSLLMSLGFGLAIIVTHAR
ncbi:hypothetical protein [Gibbsiella quercinecans]|uniref:hypothetical protein n=1 Tax=Gibbsiella quercinecans TaxID=929813 RepID=UPI0016027C1E|nr:hypothetical protein [Gibbsiella quercinecans]